jgi:hypothetical protein
MSFYLLTSLRDGYVLYDSVVDEPPSALQKALQPAIVAQGKSDANFKTRAGQWRIEWNADSALGIGTATLWRDEKLTMTMIYMAGSSPKALETARLFTRVWDDDELVKKATNGTPLFTPLLEKLKCPFGLAVNWATTSAEDLASLGEPDVAIGAAFFANLAAEPPPASAPKFMKKLFGRS